MTITDILMMLTTGFGPLVAVQVTRYLDDRREKRGRKLQVFKTLMATRAYLLSPAHVEALNRIDLEFLSKRKPEKAVLDVWQQYLDHLGNKSMEAEAWGVRRVDLLVDLLSAMATALSYDFNKTQIKNGMYSPAAHGRIENEQERIRQMTVELLEGNRPIKMFVTNLPSSEQPPAAKKTISMGAP